MLLAAGRGERMRPLTDACPKPLLRVGGRMLIEWHLLALARAGIVDVVVNHAHLGAQVEQALGDGARWKLRIRYSAEGEALETAGGIAHDYSRAVAVASRMRADDLLAWCLLVPNPPHHPSGDFALRDGRLLADGEPKLTFSGIGVYRAALFDKLDPSRKAPLAPLLRAAAAEGRAGAARHDGRWIDVGTPQRLAALDAQLQSRDP